MSMEKTHKGLDLPTAHRIQVQRKPQAPPLTDLDAAVRGALDEPVGFPPLRRALTPDDHVTIVVDETLTEPARLLAPLLEYLREAHITLDSMNLLCQVGQDRTWMEQLPQPFQEMQVVEHDPDERKKLSYLATTRNGRRLYINRNAVDADQLIVLSRRYYDPLLGVGGAEGAIFPDLADRDAQKAAFDRLSMSAPGREPWPLRQEAAEVAWLLGSPFFVQVIEGTDGAPTHVLGGLVESSTVGQQFLDAGWRVRVDRPADVVIAEVGGDPGRHQFADLARALACASRIVKPDGRIILVSGGEPELGPAAQLLRQCDTPEEALTLLKERRPDDYPAGFQWASAASQAQLYVLSRLTPEIVEEMFALPLESGDQVQRLVGSGTYVYLHDADRTLATVAKSDSVKP